MSSQSGQRHTGVTDRRTFRRSAPPPDPRLAWAVLAVGLVVTTLVVGWLFGFGSGPGPVTAAASATPTATLRTSLAPTVMPRPSASESPAPTLEPTVVATVEPSLAPTLEPTLEPSLAPTPAPTPEATPEPTPESTAPTGLAIAFPTDGERLSNRVINVTGTAPPGSTITRDVPLWFDDHVTTRDDGIWMMPVQLGDGSNQLSFRIGDDQSTEIHLTVVFEASG